MQAALGEAPVATTPNRFERNGLVVSSCYFAASSPANSANLTVWQLGPGAGADALQVHWKEMFPANSLVDHPRAEGGIKLAPQKVEGLGRQALWAVDDRMNALHVLAPDYIIMASVGSAGTKEDRLARARKLAAHLLSQLHPTKGS